MNTPAERARVIAANKQDLVTARDSVAKWTERVYSIQRVITGLELADTIATHRELLENAANERAKLDAEAAKAALPDA